jgi:chromosome segregation ATPase
LEEKVKLIQGSVDYAFRTRKKVEISLEAATSELARKTTESAHLAAKIDNLKEWESDLKSTKEDLKRNYSALQERYYTVNKLFAQSEQATLQLKKDLQAALTQVAVLKEELWKRDNTLLRKECRKIKLMEQVDSLRSTIQINYTRYRASESSSEKSKRPPLPRIPTSQGARNLLKPTPELLSALEQCLRDQQSAIETSQPVRRLKSEYLPYLRSVVGVDEAADYPHLQGLFTFLTVNSLTVQQIVDQISSLSA